MNNSLKLSKDVAIRLRWIRIVSYCKFDNGKTERPDIGSDAIGS